jgi:hypothetical protein
MSSSVKALHTSLLVVGILLFLAGLTFTLQGYGILGPSNGLMFQNKTWVYAGLVTLVVGIVLAYAAVHAGRRTPLKDNRAATPQA